MPSVGVRIALGILVVVALIGLVTAITINFKRGIAVRSVLPPLAISVLPPYDTFTMLSGTLIFYPNNANQEVPYIEYTNANGNTATKALLLAPETALPAAGAAIRVSGYLENEHIRVTALE